MFEGPGLEHRDLYGCPVRGLAIPLRLHLVEALEVLLERIVVQTLLEGLLESLRVHVDCVERDLLVVVEDLVHRRPVCLLDTERREPDERRHPQRFAHPLPEQRHVAAPDHEAREFLHAVDVRVRFDGSLEDRLDVVVGRPDPRLDGDHAQGGELIDVLHVPLATERVLREDDEPQPARADLADAPGDLDVLLRDNHVTDSGEGHRRALVTLAEHSIRHAHERSGHGEGQQREDARRVDDQLLVPMEESERGA